jgi:catechol 2,3-dioxygenase-like lactoylglutathione lyase family enzyme
MSARAEVQELSPEELAHYTTRGEATGKIVGVNHMMLVCRDFERSLTFYRDILGFKLISHTSGRAYDPADRSKLFAYDSISFFRVAPRFVFGLYEIRHAEEQAHASTTLEIWPNKEEHHLPPHPFGLDHISFHVPTWKDVLWFREHLQSQGVAVSPIFDFADGGAQRMFDENWPAFASEPSETPWLRDKSENVLSGSVYFYDPDGNALEVSTDDWTRE